MGMVMLMACCTNVVRYVIELYILFLNMGKVARNMRQRLLAMCRHSYFES